MFLLTVVLNKILVFNVVELRIRFLRY